MRTALILRSRERAEHLGQRLTERKIRVLMAPITEILPPTDPAPLATATSRIKDFDWVVLTSVNTVLALAEVATDLSNRKQALAATLAPGPRWAVVGPGTASALRAVGVTPDLVAAGTAADLIAAFPNASPPNSFPCPPQSHDLLPDQNGPDAKGRSARVLLPLGNLAGNQLETSLAAKGWETTRVEAYRTISHALPDDVIKLAQRGEINVAIVAAGSQARELARQLGGFAPPVVTIGEPSAEAALAVELHVVGVATEPTDDALASVTLRYLEGLTP